MPSAKAVTQRVQAFKQTVSDIPGRLFIAYSGGADSNHLLDLAMEAAPERVVLCHFNHAWSELSDTWQAQANARAKALSIKFRSARDEDPDHSELSARKARYTWLESLLEPGDAVLTAHHRGDDLETLWMRVSQGRPPRRIPFRRPLGQGWLIRPLIERERRPHAQAIEDPANQSLKYRRVQVRQLLTEVPEEVVEQLQRLARLFERLEQLVVQQIPHGPFELNHDLPKPLLRHAISVWIWRVARLPAPPSIRLDTLLDQLPARPDRHPAIQWDAEGTRMALRVYRNQIYLEPAVWIAPMPQGPWRPLAANESKALHARTIPPWHRPWVWHHQSEPKLIRWWFPVVSEFGEIKLDYRDLND